MSLKGNLQSVDLANVLQMLSINQKEGALVLFDGDTRKSIYFSRDGVSMLSRGRKGQDSLGRILMRYGKITAEQLAQALARQEAEGKRLGEILGEMAAVTPEDVENAVRTQIEEEIYNLFIWKEASFEFLEGPPPVAEGAPGQVTFNVNSLIMEAQRRADEWNYIRGLVPALEEIYKPTETLATATVTDEVFHLPFAPKVLEVLHQGRLNVNEVIEASCAAKFEACKMLAILLEQGAIEPVSIADLQTMAQAATAANDHPNSAKYLSRIVDLGGATPPVNMQLGYALEALDEPERASLYLKAAAESYVELVEPAHAFEAYKRVAQSLPTDLQAVTQMVEIACNHPEILAAHSHDVIEAGRTLARCQKELGRLPASLQILHRLAQSTPQDLPLRTMLVQAYQESGMNNEAMAELESMAEVCRSQGNHDEAIRCLRKVTAIDRNRPGVLKKIDDFTRIRDRGKRVMLRAVAAVAVLVSLGAAAWGFLWFQGAKERHRTEVEKLIADRLDPLVDDFSAAEQRFAAADKNLTEIADTTAVESVAKDVAELNAAAQAMDDIKASMENRARALLAEHEDDCEPTENLVEKRTAAMRRVILEKGRQRETDLARIVEHAQDLFRRARKEAEHHPISSILPVERAVGLLKAAGAEDKLDIPIESRVENAEETLKQLHKYREELEGVQRTADEQWAAGRRDPSRDLMADYLVTFPSVTEFRELLRFRVWVTTIPAGALVRVPGVDVEGSGLPAPREIAYSAAAGLRLEVTAEGFQPRSIEIPRLPEKVDARTVRNFLPSTLPVVLSKVPLWSLPLSPSSLEAAPVATPDGKFVVIPDRAGIVHLVSVEEGRETASLDAGTLSGFPAAAVVTGDAAFAASLDGVVVAMDLPGLRQRWRVAAEGGPGPVSGRPVLCGDLLVVASTSGTVKAFRVADGSPAWEVRLPAGTRRDLALIGGRIVALCDDGLGRVIAADGKEVLPFLPTSSPHSSYPAPVLGPVGAGPKVLLGLEGVGQEASIVDLPLPGSTGVQPGYRWGVSIEGTEPVAAVVSGEDILLVFRSGMARLATINRGGKAGSLPFRVFGEKEKAIGNPVLAEGTYFQSTDKALGAFRLTGTEIEELWRWNDAGESVLSTPVAIAGRFVVVGTRDGRLHGLLKD